MRYRTQAITSTVGAVMLVIALGVLDGDSIPAILLAGFGGGAFGWGLMNMTIVRFTERKYR